MPKVEKTISSNKRMLFKYMEINTKEYSRKIKNYYLWKRRNQEHETNVDLTDSLNNAHTCIRQERLGYDAVTSKSQIWTQHQKQK